ncbi:hypothetical protein AJ79_04049 [Helicocarpus griseus UAMH5409]|uniref:Glutamyl-tRNA amidotransferase complex subunit Gta3 domain-containing protein n=1 Tax=Helicocarpus griseus UAMH5409 TaxID=1447875 RepID=A0A2B7XV51_9EURO|nr:hypothetical protein AJ79_04049 [Helicocarpus griseus UAMH5409]
MRHVLVLSGQLSPGLNPINFFRPLPRVFQRPYSAVGRETDPATILSKPTWSVKSLLPHDSPHVDEHTVTSKQLHHLLRLSALPPPSSTAEEEEMIKTLESQIHFVGEIQQIDTAGISPLRSIRDDTENGRALRALDDKTFDELNKGTRYVGRRRRIERQKAGRITHPDGEVWDGDALKAASKTMGRYFVVQSSGEVKEAPNDCLPWKLRADSSRRRRQSTLDLRLTSAFHRLSLFTTSLSPSPSFVWLLILSLDYSGIPIARILDQFVLPLASANRMMASPTHSTGQAGRREMRQGQQGKREVDLATVLSLQERQYLALLIVDIMDVMQQTICDHFNSEEESKTPPGHRDPSSDDNNYTATKQERPPLPPRRSSTKEVKAEAESLRYFSFWKDSVVARIGEIINNPDSTESQKNQQQRDVQVSAEQEGVAAPDSTESVQKSASLATRYLPVETPLSELPRATKLVILHSMLLLLLSLQHYSAHSRVLLLRMASSLGMSVDDVVNNEVTVAEGLLTTAKAMSADEEAKARVEDSKLSRKWKVGLASVAGGILIGVTGGLAAPFVAAGVGAIMGGLGLGATVAATYLGAVASSAAIIGGIFGAYGARMTGRMMERYAKEVEDFAFLPIHAPLPPDGEDITTVPTDQRLRVTIAISGWLTEEADFVNPWRVLGRDSEAFALRWEFKALVRLGNALTTVVRHAAWTFASKHAIAGTVFAPIAAAMMWPVALLKLSHIVDNPFSIAKIRADKAGQVLADALINRAQGERPVTLVGYSLGARVIFSCLLTLSRRGAYGLVESAVLMGSPTPSTSTHWRLMRTVVSGRLVNAYSLNDAILGFLYRANSAQLDIAGLEPVKDVPGVENFDVSDLVSGHLRYQHMVGSILNTIGYDHLDQAQLRRQADISRAKDERDKKRAEFEQERAQARMEQQQRGENDVPEPSPAEVHRLEREVEEQTREAMDHTQLGRSGVADRTNR